MTTTALDRQQVHHSNTAQADAWDGTEGAYWASHADDFDRSTATYHRALLEAVAVESADRVLDIGCGSGQLARDAARVAPQGHAIGVDLSSDMLAVARSRAAAEGLGNVEFICADAQVHEFDAGSFDVAASRFGAMFFGDPVAAFNNIGRALRPGGRLALVAWQPIERNPWLTSILGALAAGRPMGGPPADAPGPFGLSEPDRVSTILTAAGFDAPRFDAIESTTWFGDTAEAATDFIAGLQGWMLRDLDDGQREGALATLHDMFAAHVEPDGVRLGSAAWVITATRH